jgi:CubicO group peptidase (beta-lactamase class C family)
MSTKNMRLTTKRSLVNVVAMLMTLALLLTVVAPALAQKNEAEDGKYESVVTAQAQGPTDPAELEAFLDELMAKDMEEHHIPGADVSVVKDGALFFDKGYGYADLENKIPVDAEETIFPTGSIGKLFSWLPLISTIVSFVIFIAIAIWRFNRQEF